MGWPYFRLHISSFSIPDETSSRLEKAREEWIRKHVEKDMDNWQSRNPRITQFLAGSLHG